MDLTAKYTIDKNKVTYRIIDAEAVILNLDNGFYYSLNKIGTLVWQVLIEGEDLNQALENISCRYQVPEKIIRADVNNLINDLRKENLVEVKK